MLKYTFQRIIAFIPMLIAISLLSFIISINAPGDPVERLAKSSESEGGAQEQSGASKKIKAELRKKLGLDLPIFMSVFPIYLLLIHYIKFKINITKVICQHLLTKVVIGKLFLIIIKIYCHFKEFMNLLIQKF